MRKLRRLRALALAVCGWGVCGAAGAQAVMSLGAEGEIAQKAEVPAVVVRLLAQQPDVRDTMRSEAGSNSVPSGWYEAATVTLTGGRPALLVRGKCPLCGAHAGWFWFFEQRGGRWTMVLHAAGDQVRVLPAKGGSAEVEVSSVDGSSATHTLYRLGGVRYRAVRSWSGK